MIEENKNVQTAPTRTYCKRSRPCPTVIKIVGRPGTGSLSRTIAPPDHPRQMSCNAAILNKLHSIKPSLAGPRSAIGRAPGKSGSWVRYSVWQHTFVSPSAFSRGAVVSYWRKYVNEVLVNRLGGLSLSRLLVGCFGFNGPLRQYFSLYRAVSQR